MYIISRVISFAYMYQPLYEIICINNNGTILVPDNLTASFLVGCLFSFCCPQGFAGFEDGFDQSMDGQ